MFHVTSDGAGFEEVQQESGRELTELFLVSGHGSGCLCVGEGDRDGEGPELGRTAVEGGLKDDVPVVPSANGFTSSMRSPRSAAQAARSTAQKKGTRFRRVPGEPKDVYPLRQSRGAEQKYIAAKINRAPAMTPLKTRLSEAQRAAALLASRLVIATCL